MPRQGEYQSTFLKGLPARAPERAAQRSMGDHRNGGMLARLPLGSKN